MSAPSISSSAVFGAARPSSARPPSAHATAPPPLSDATQYLLSTQGLSVHERLFRTGTHSIRRPPSARSVVAPPLPPMATGRREPLALPTADAPFARVAVLHSAAAPTGALRVVAYGSIRSEPTQKRDVALTHRGTRRNASGGFFLQLDFYLLQTLCAALHDRFACIAPARHSVWCASPTAY